jgi:hypothetical protein
MLNQCKVFSLFSSNNIKLSWSSLYFCVYTSFLKMTSDSKILLSKIHSSHTEIFFDPVGFWHNRHRLPFPLSVIRTSIVLLSVVFIPQHVYNILRIAYNNHEGVFFIILQYFHICITSVIEVANSKYMHTSELGIRGKLLTQFYKMRTQ